MEIALKEAEKALLRDSVPVGAVIELNGNIIASESNKVEKNHSIVSHAEILAIQKASKILKQKYLSECSIYVTLEPCAMCAQAISFAHFKNLYFGAYDTKYGAILNGAHIFQTALYVPNIIGGILESECKNLMKNFFQKKRT